MTKVDIKRLDSITKNDTTATEQINDNFKALQEAIENTLSRDGTGPNFMDADLDMNSYRIINSAYPAEDNDIVNLKYVEERIGGAVEASKTAVSAATQAANSAQSALVSSTEAINTLRNTEEQLNNVIQYVDEAKQSIDQTIDEAIADVKQQALDAAQESIDTAAAQATEIVVDYANNELKPLLNEIAANAEADAGNAAESAEIASNESDEAKHWAEDSRIWATGEDAEVEEIAPGEEEHSSRGYADLAMAIANTPEDVPVDTSKLLALNIFKGEKGDKGDKGDKGEDGKDGKIGIESFATNCITEIPQDIKLELVDGLLTLKAGSKVYVPNGKNADGSNKFDEVVIESDIARAPVSWNDTYFLSINPQGFIYLDRPDRSFSGGTPQTSADSAATWYDTNENIIKVTNDKGATWTGGYSLPLAIVKSIANSGYELNQVFNGFGYIGSTVFALPNIKGLIPNGRNEDGSLNNVEFTTDKVLLQQTLYNTNGASLGLSSSFVNYVTINDVVYDEKDNKNIVLSDGRQWRGCFAGSVSVSDMKFTSFNPKTAFHAVDRNDSSWIAGQAMPSDKYIDLTLGASGSSYAAPANGWFFLGANASSATNEIVFYDISNASGYAFSQAQSNYPIRCMQAVRKGSALRIDYVGIKTPVGWFRFIYAEGEK